jgi:hypothetical protein
LTWNPNLHPVHISLTKIEGKHIFLDMIEICE